MIPRYQRIVFWGLIGAITLMALVLIRGCRQAQEKLTRVTDATPLAAPVATPSEPVTLMLANDADGSIGAAERQAALPAEPTVRARAVLARLISEYSIKNSAHPLESGPAIDDVFLVALPIVAPVKTGSPPAPVAGAYVPTLGPRRPGGQLAVVNLHGAFCDHHPSGIEPELLTVESIVGTLHANFPQVEEVRFLVDGQPRETLNGHIDLMRDYPVIETSGGSQPFATQP